MKRQVLRLTFCHHPRSALEALLLLVPLEVLLLLVVCRSCVASSMTGLVCLPPG